GLQAMVPARTAAGVVASVTRDGSPLTFAVSTVKGRDYASVAAQSGAFVVTYAPDTTAPTVVSTSPAGGATGIAQTSTVLAAFSEPLDPTTVSGSTFTLRDPSNAPVSATVTYDAATNSAVLTPGALLDGSTTYSATVTGGAGGIKDIAGNPLAANVTWS